jgi:hypothetical protein
MAIEKYGALWCEDGHSGILIYEEFLSGINKVHAVFQDARSKCYLPYSYIKTKDPTVRIAIWSPENEKAIMPTLKSAKEYLKSWL